MLKLENWDIVHSWNLKLHRNTSSPHQNLQNRCWHGLTLGWNWGHFFQIFWDFSKSIFVIPNHLWDVRKPPKHHKQWFGVAPEPQNWEKLEKLKISIENEELWRKQRRKQCTFVFNWFFMVRSTLLFDFLIWFSFQFHHYGQIWKFRPFAHVQYFDQ